MRIEPWQFTVHWLLKETLPYCPQGWAVGLIYCRVAKSTVLVSVIKPWEAEGFLLGAWQLVSLQDAGLLSHSSRNMETQPAWCGALGCSISHAGDKKGISDFNPSSLLRVPISFAPGVDQCRI